jgi:YesN/AraC family two-component response regulator
MQNLNQSLPIGSIDHSITGSVIYSAGGKFGPRLQTGLELVLLYTGELDLYLDKEHHHIPQGNVVFLKPGKMEEFHFSKHEETQHSFIILYFQDPNQIFTEYESLPLYLPISNEMNRIVDLILSFKLMNHAENDALPCTLAAAAISLYLHESQQSMTTLKHPLVEKAKSFIQQWLSSPLSLVDISNHVNVSPEYLIRLFRKYENATPVNYLWNSRLKRGVELLTNSGLNVSEVAYQVGFKNPFHFSKCFKKHYGLTPSEVKTNHQKEIPRRIIS